ncbi:hypothetical protein ACFQY7_15120 [Actinomadura luteofluorescens]|uniref:hypothetical protein n=1 Tax=Actinomadura luteofluorescens TaxID=46163 RepID=UPI003628EE48
MAGTSSGSIAARASATPAVAISAPVRDPRPWTTWCGRIRALIDARSSRLWNAGRSNSSRSTAQATSRTRPIAYRLSRSLSTSSRDEATATATATRAVRASTTAPCARTAVVGAAERPVQQPPPAEDGQHQAEAAGRLQRGDERELPGRRRHREADGAEDQAREPPQAGLRRLRPLGRGHGRRIAHQ